MPDDATPSDPSLSDSSEPAPVRKTGKYRRARIRSFLFTHGPNRLSGGRVMRRHLGGDVRIHEMDIAAPNWPSAFDGLRIGHVSDFHLGELLPLDRALDIVELMAQQEPDLIACTGDVVDLHHGGEDELFEAMRAINAPFGCYLVLGNHDELHCGETLAATAESKGITVLRNDRVHLKHNGTSLHIAGIDWAGRAAACRRLVQATCDDDTHLLLAHNPKAFRAAADAGIPLTLSGHTHGGQVAMRSRPGVNLSLSHRLSSGVYERGDSRLYVTNGVGAWFPLRVNCPAEIAMITMRCTSG